LMDQHALALLMATRLSERPKAIRLLEELSSHERLAASERFELVRLYLADDNWEKARMHMLTLLASPEGKNPMYQSYYARHLLRHGAIEEAQAQLTLLEKAQPDAPLTKEIKARVRRAQGKHDEAVAAVRECARCKGMDAGQGALLMESLGQPS